MAGNRTLDVVSVRGVVGFVQAQVETIIGGNRMQVDM